MTNDRKPQLFEVPSAPEARRVTGREGRLYALHCGGDFSDWAVFDPFDAQVGAKVYNPYLAFVYVHRDGVVLFDTGADPDLSEKLGAPEGFDLEVGPGDRVDRRLEQIGMTVESVDVVVQSHLHFDHTGGLGLFGHAPVLLQRDELEFASAPPAYQRDVYLPDDFAAMTNWELLEGDHDVFGDGRAMVLRTPGHTPGHQSLLVALADRDVLLLGDAAYLVEKMRERRLPALIWSPDAQMETWERLESIERDRGALLVATHEPDFRNQIRMAPDAWYE